MLLSSVLLTLMLVLSMAADIGEQPLVFGALVVVLAALVTGWVAVERRAASPLVDLRMLAKPAIWSSYVITFAVCVGTAVSMFMVPQLFAVSGDGYGFGADSTDIGRYLLPGTVMAAISGPLGGIAARRFGAAPRSAPRSASWRPHSSPWRSCTPRCGTSWWARR